MKTDNKTPLTCGAGIATALNFVSIEGTTNTAHMDMYFPQTLVDAVVTAETIELKYIKRARYSYTSNQFYVGVGTGGYPNNYINSSPDIAIKEIYGCRDGKLTLLKTVQGRVIPPQELPETLEFDDEIDE